MTKEEAAEYYQANKEKIAERRKKHYQDNKEKAADYYQANKKKISEYAKKYNQANKEKVAKRTKKYQEANREKYAEYNQANKDKRTERAKKYYQDNKEKVAEYYQDNKEKVAEYQRERRNTNPLFKMKCSLRTRTSVAFKRKGYKKNSKTEQILGISYEKVKQHIGRQFKKGMTWSNYGEWHIDHIIPLASAKTQTDLLNLCHYRNLQPLWAAENISKGAKMPQVQKQINL